MARSRFSTIAALSLPKDGGRGDDRGARSDERGAWALCDGASDCYDGAGWAEALARSLCRRYRPEAALVEARRAYSLSRPRGGGWLEEAARGRGSWSTALVARASPSGLSVSVNALGDTVFFLLDGFETEASFPIDDASRFGTTPELLPDRGGPSPAFASRAFGLSALRRPRFALATDALAARILSEPAGGGAVLWRFLLGCSAPEFASWARAEIEAGRMKRDDLSLLAAG